MNGIALCMPASEKWPIELLGIFLWRCLAAQAIWLSKQCFWWYTGAQCDNHWLRNFTCSHGKLKL